MLSDFIQVPNLRIMGTEEEQAKGIYNIFNKITENFPNLEKVLPILTGSLQYTKQT
jgi:hypothetical protein